MFQNVPLPPTSLFKCKSLILFAIMGELMALMLPMTIRISMIQVLRKGDFKEIYCVCGVVSLTEMDLISHLRINHPAIHRMFLHLKYASMPVEALDLKELCEKDPTIRSKQLGSMSE